MGGINFLNIEYLLLRVGDIFGSLSTTFLGAPASGSGAGATQGSGLLGENSTQLTSNITFTLQQIALLGMALSILLLALAVWVRIKLELYEHEEFHKRDAKYGGHGGHGGHDAHGTHDAHAGHETQDSGHVDTSSAPVLGIEHALAPHEPNKNIQRWQHVFSLASSQNESDWRRAIVEADIMLGEVLEAQGYRGSTIGEMLKDANPLQFRTLDLAWQAHKVRNDIAHGGESFHLSSRDVRATIDQYKRVFEEFAFII